ncbi:hypothetical protein QAO71_17490 (plasmid) [Halopseudomonas sp. SMJS2]|uniref:hypothetical protein n=1 Tax=Halopseudomonas sp. SMJS2 TaxID=3041098 RepID=UPI002452AD60|nr:hypothetical protein [Halopseudomonas sp. SMJS2]WGK63335.1 hypothetical protein QAO71_17490 [Halopseudomonas sp. SMJS2]
MVIEDKRQQVHGSPAVDLSLLEASNLNISGELKQQFRADALNVLSEDEQPTDDQWRAILSVHRATCTSGIAGTGKTHVMALRLVLLHVYLKVSLDRITLLCLTRDCRLDVTRIVRGLLGRWGREYSECQILEVVKTPQGAALGQLRSLPDLQSALPFELLAEPLSNDEDGRPFDSRLTRKQLSVLNDAYSNAYLRNQNFAADIKAAFKAGAVLKPLSVDDPVVMKAAPIAWKQAAADLDISETMEKMWTDAGAWPLKGIKAEVTAIEVRGHTFYANGYSPALDAYVVLGFDRAADRNIKRDPRLSVPLAKECAVKRTILQAYAPKPIVYLESYDDAQQLVESMALLNTKAPIFDISLKNQSRPFSVVEMLYQQGNLIETLGVPVAQAISSLNFLPGDSEIHFYRALAHFWVEFEAYLLASEPKMVTSNRMFNLLGAYGESNISHLPARTIKRMEHVLVDEVQDLTVPIGEWVKSCLQEARRRRHQTPEPGAELGSLFITGDDYQTAHGTQGATSRYLLNFEAEFRCSANSTRRILGENFRSQQGIIDAAHSMVLGLPAVNAMAPSSRPSKQTGSRAPILISYLERKLFVATLREHFSAGDDILILAANQDDFRMIEPLIKPVIDEDKRLNPERRRVRVRACQRAKGLEAQTVLIVGDFTARFASWTSNQLFTIAAPGPVNSQTPFDTLQENELFRLAHIGITRAKENCHWFVRPADKGEPQLLRASSRIAAESNYIRDLR